MTALHDGRELTPPPGAIIVCNLDPVAAQRKLCAILARLSSPFDGEKLAAARLANELIARLGLQWADVVRINGVIENRPSPAPPDWRTMLRVCAQRFQYLSEREQNFVSNLASWSRRPSERQLAWLRVIFERITA